MAKNGVETHAINNFIDDKTLQNQLEAMFAEQFGYYDYGVLPQQQPFSTPNKTLLVSPQLYNAIQAVQESQKKQQTTKQVTKPRFSNSS